MTKIDVICGFLNYGKTTYINKYINDHIKDKIVILSFESGKNEYIVSDNIIKIIKADNKINNKLLKDIKDKYNPDIILIEFNAMYELDLIYSQKLDLNLKINKIIYIVNEESFLNTFDNLYTYIKHQLDYADIIIINGKKNKYIEKRLRLLNKNAIIINTNLKNEEIDYSEMKYNINNILLITLGIFIFILTNFIIYSFGGLENNNYFSKIYIGIILSIIPIVLFGAFVSSIVMQLKLYKYLKILLNNNIGSLFIIPIIPLIFPVCDCGLIPLINNLLKNKAKLSNCITFYLSLSGLNFIVIFATYIAFYDKKIVIYRIVLNIIISILVGIILKLSNIDSKDYLNDNAKLTIYFDKEKNLFYRILINIREEFLNSMKYIIVATFFTCTLIIIFKNINFTKNIFSQFMFMTVISSFMSVCSSSNALIVKAFSPYLDKLVIIFFMVLGPMIDLKNIVLLSSIIKVKYLLYIIICIFLVTVLLFLSLKFFI